MDQCLEASHKQILEQKLTVSQRLMLKKFISSMMIQLAAALQGEKYRPRAECPKCGRKLTSFEILRGFGTDPNNFDTTCTGCGKKFRPSLVAFGAASTIELPFYCAVQVLPLLEKYAQTAPLKVKDDEPAVYRSAIAHYGTLKNAFTKLGIKYDFEEIPDWRDKVVPFLGRLYDGTIAKLIGVSPEVISRLRNNLRIPRATKQSMLEEAEDFREEIA